MNCSEVEIFIVFLQLRPELSGFVGEELEKIKRSHKELSSLFNKAEEDEGEEEEEEEEAGRMEDLKQLVEEMRLKVKLDRLVEVSGCRNKYLEREREGTLFPLDC